MREIVVGLHQSGPISSAAIIADGRLIAAAPEERFSRIKQDDAFPKQALAYCLKEAGVTAGEVSRFAVGWNAGESVALRYRRGFSDWMRYPGEWLASVPNHLLPGMLLPRSSQSRFADGRGGEAVIDYVDHHSAHARLVFHGSGFDRAAVVVADGWSEQKTTSIFLADSNALTMLESEVFPNSIGCVYAGITEYLGFRPFSDEWKVMGMAAYGDPAAVPDAERMIVLLPDGRYEVDLKYFDFFNFDRSGFCSPRMENLIGPRRGPNEPLTQRHFDIAAALQALFSRLMTNLVGRAHRLTGQDNLCLSGGTAMNCLFNGSVTAHTPFRRCYVGFAPDDSGNSIGAALDVAVGLGQAIQSSSIVSAVGPGFTADFVKERLDAYKIRYTICDDVADRAAELLASGKIVAWFQGRSEFGQRALGHRSILASPLQASVKDRLNMSIKYRESFRPFAPILPVEAMAATFDNPDADPVRFMEKAYRFRSEAAKKAPGAVHADGTGRLQTVDRADEPLLHRLLLEFGKRSGISVLINTSFNTAGEPVVLSPDDAIRTFYTSGLDAMIMENCLIEKPQ